MIRKAASFGWDLEPYLASGHLNTYHVGEGALDLDVVASFIRALVAGRSVHRMVIDSLSEMVVVARKSAGFPAYERGLLGWLRAAGVSLLTTSETSSLGPTAEAIGGLSFLYHNVVLLRYIAQESEVGRAVAILKMRDSDHDKGLWSFSITDHGVEVNSKLARVTGLLGWTALVAEPPNPVDKNAESASG